MTASASRLFVRCAVATLALVLLSSESIAQSGAPGRRSLARRSQLDSLASAAEQAALTSRDKKVAQRKRGEAERLRARLRDGDFKVGDRVILAVPGNAELSDTMTVRSGLRIELPNLESVPVAGLLRSELQPTMEQHIAKYVKDVRVSATPLTRVAVTGEVARPGFYSFDSDILLSDVIMQAGGPTVTADLRKMSIRRGGSELWSAGDTRAAISLGYTLDEFGLEAGDELVIGRKRELGSQTVLGVVAGIGSLLGIVVALSR
ncbi:MAG TPA: SLBB domain-containing protein [Gemmatimonadaceae bacterium]|nr:SLBB domain-containing protein [Gemmatimonadaceae bacterium]